MDELAQRIIFKWEAGGKTPVLIARPGCFTGDMLIATPTGMQEIRTLKRGDIVYDGDGNYTTIANACRIDDDPKPMIYWTTNAGQKKGATYDHPFYDKRTRRFYPLYQFIWGDLEARQRTQLELLCKQYGQAFDPYSLRGIQAEDYATSDGYKWLPTNTGRWEDRENTQACSTDVYPESATQDTRESQELRQSRQQSSKLRVGDGEGKPRLQLSRWTYTEARTSEPNTAEDESKTHFGNKRLCELLEQRVRQTQTRGQSVRSTEEQNESRHNISQASRKPEAILQEVRAQSNRDNEKVQNTRATQKKYTNKLRVCESELRDIEIREREPYYSIEIQGRNKTYIIEDGWIVHNCGKTAFVSYLAQKLGVGLHVINLATFEEMDMNGMPYINPDTHEINMTKPFFARDVKPGDIIFWDECNLPSAGVRNGLQTMLLNHTLPTGEPLPEGVRFIGAMNTTSDLDSVADFSNAMKDRWAYIPFNFPVDEWHKMFKDNFGKPQTEREKAVRAKLSQFLTTNPQLLEGRKPIKASSYGITDEVEATAIEAATPNRRNWDNLARELAQTTEENEKQYRKYMFIENVGLECWRNYKEFIATENKPLSTYKWDGEPDEISQQVARLKATKDADKQAEYFVRAHKYCAQKEVVAAVLPDVLRNVIGKYGLDYRAKLPDFYEVYKEIGA